MLKKQYVSMRLLPIIVAFTLAFGFMTTVQRFDSYADESTYPTTTLKVVGAKEEATWQILKTMPFKEMHEYGCLPEDVVFADYEMGTPVERTWNNTGEDGVVPWWSIKLSDLEKCGTVTGVSLYSENDKNYLRGYYASDQTQEYYGTSLTEYDVPANPFYGIITIDNLVPEKSKYDTYNFSCLAYNRNTDSFIEPYSDINFCDQYDYGMYAEVYVDEGSGSLLEHKDDLNTVFTIYFNGEERKLDLDCADMEVEAGQTAKREAKPQSSYYGDAVVTYASNDESIATVDENGEVTGVAAGETSITASIKDGDKETSKSYKVIVSNAADPAVDEVVGAIDNLPEPDKLTLDNENDVNAAQDAYDRLSPEQRAKVTNYNVLLEARLKIADLKLKKAEADIAELTTAKETAEGELQKAEGEKQAALDELNNVKAEIAASKLTVSGLKVTSKAKKFTITWKKNAKADGYRVQYRMKGAKKFKTLKTVTKAKVVSKKLKKNKRYQFRVATYRIVDNKKVYGKWSPIKTAKCK